MTVVFIIANSITLGVSYHKSDNDKILENLNLAFFSFFVLELIIKITGRGIIHYLKDRFNWFDAFIILMSGVDIIVTNTFSCKSFL